MRQSLTNYAARWNEGFLEQFGSVSVTADSGNASITYPRRVNSCAESEFAKIRRQRLPPAPAYRSRRPRNRSPFGSGRLAPRTTHRSNRSRNSGRGCRDRRTTTSAAQNASQPDTAIQIIDACFSSQPSIGYQNGPDCATSAPSRGGIHSAWSAKLRPRYLVYDPHACALAVIRFRCDGPGGSAPSQPCPGLWFLEHDRDGDVYKGSRLSALVEACRAYAVHATCAASECKP